MFVTHVGLVDFRSYEHVEFDLAPGVTTLVGPNGQGKTNLVEGVGYACTLRSHRVAVDAPLVRRGADRAIVRVGADRGGHPCLVEIEVNPGRSNRARLNRTPVPRQRDVLGHVVRVLFSPEDLVIVKGDPGERRSYLDELLVAMSPTFDAVLADLDRVLRQRNSLLRSASTLRGAGAARGRAAAEQTLSVWDEQYSALAAQALAARMSLVERLSGPLADSYRDVAPGATSPQVEAHYVSSVPDVHPGMDRADLARAVGDSLRARREDELLRGVTLTGPHRDDLYLGLHGMPVKGYASHGESWSMALALRLASHALVRESMGSVGDPVLVLDDVFAELDTQRRERLALAVGKVEQVLVTAAAAQDVPASLAGRTLDVRDGFVRPRRARPHADG